MSSPACRTCFFFHHGYTADTGLYSNYEYGECRKNPPVANFSEYDIRERAFPIVRTVDWCGQWRSQNGECL